MSDVRVLNPRRHGRLVFPFRAAPKEVELIERNLFEEARPVIVIGRSGTGKTTTTLEIMVGRLMISSAKEELSKNEPDTFVLFVARSENLVLGTVYSYNYNNNDILYI